MEETSILLLDEKVREICLERQNVYAAMWRGLYSSKPADEDFLILNPIANA
jgi:hypothetical protein